MGFALSLSRDMRSTTLGTATNKYVDTQKYELGTAPELGVGEVLESC